MDMVTITIMIVTANTYALLGLWLRLRCKVRREQTRQQYLAAVAEAVAADGQVEVDDQLSDGRRLRMKFSRTSTWGEDRAA